MKRLSYSIIALLLSAGIVCFAVKFTAGQTADADAEVENVEKKSPVGKLVSTDKNPLLLVKLPQGVANQRINHMALVTTRGFPSVCFYERNGFAVLPDEVTMAGYVDWPP